VLFLDPLNLKHHGDTENTEDKNRDANPTQLRGATVRPQIRGLRGRVDELAIWNRALAQHEIG
jgi:hypothetical protein